MELKRWYVEYGNCNFTYILFRLMGMSFSYGGFERINMNLSWFFVICLQISLEISCESWLSQLSEEQSKSS